MSDIKKEELIEEDRDDDDLDEDDFQELKKFDELLTSLRNQFKSMFQLYYY